MESLHRSRLGTPAFGIIALIATALALAAGFCVFDDHAGAAHDHGLSIDLCLGMLGVATVVAPLIALFATGWALALPPLAVVPAPLHVVDPPPRLRPIR
jgi:hypothetical protein